MKKLTMEFIINFSYCIAMVSSRYLIFERPRAAEKSYFPFQGLLEKDIKILRLKLHACKHGPFLGI